MCFSTGRQWIGADLVRRGGGRPTLPPALLEPPPPPAKTKRSKTKKDDGSRRRCFDPFAGLSTRDGSCGDGAVATPVAAGSEFVFRLDPSKVTPVI